MTVKRKNTIFRKVFSFAMSLLITLSMINVNALSAWAAENDNYKNKTPLITPVEEGTISKIVSQSTGEGLKENEFFIDLKVTGKEIDNSKATDIVLVVDRSGSMNGTRMANAKTAANNFIDKLLQTSNNPNASKFRIGLVDFEKDSNSTNLLGTSGINTLKSRVDGLSAYGGTFTMLGLKNAKELLDNSTADNKIIVLISDGLPTYIPKSVTEYNYQEVPYGTTGITHYKEYFRYKKKNYWSDYYEGSSNNINYGQRDKNFIQTPNTYYDWNQRDGDGKETLSNLDLIVQPTLNYAAEIKNNYKIYSVGIELEYAQHTNSYHGKTFMKNVSSGDGYFYEGNSNQLVEILQKIAGGITHTISQGIIEDKMGDFIIYDTTYTPVINTTPAQGATDAPPNPILTSPSADGILRVTNLDLGKDQAVNIRYKIKLDVDNPSFIFTDSEGKLKWYDTNAYAKLYPKGDREVIRIFNVPQVRSTNLK